MRILSLILVCFLFSCGRNQPTLKIKGSDTEVNLVAELAENFHESHRESYLSISGGGSGLGIASLLNGQADIANSSRELNEFEKSLFTKKNIALDTFVFAEDAIAFVVSARLPLDSVNIEQLSGILTGEITNWSSLTGKPMEINIYGRQSNSGTYDFVMSKLNLRFTRNAKEMNGNAQILEAIKADPSGIGYVGAGYVLSARNQSNENIKVLKISSMDGDRTAYSPLDSNAVFEHKYFFRRHLFQYILRSSRNAAAAFIAFEKGPSGSSIIRQSGYYPVKK